MKHYLLPEAGRFYKANLHMHTTISDGKMTPEETKAFFLERGYSIVAFTDHEVIVPHNDLTDGEFLALTAVEAATNDDWPNGYPHCRCYHVNLYAKDQNARAFPVFDERYVWPAHVAEYLAEECKGVKYLRHYSVEGMNDLIAKANDAGFLVSFNHPNWSNQRYPDYAGLKGLWGVEIFNTGCFRMGYKEETQPLEDLLHLNESVFPLCTDDAHRIEDCAGGWVQVKAETLEYGTVMGALERGDFYASTGPEIHELYIEGGYVHLTCSDAREIFLRTERRCTRATFAKAGESVREVTYNLNDFLTESKNERAMRYRPWFRLEIYDHDGKAAYTRAYFVDEIPEA